MLVGEFKAGMKIWSILYHSIHGINKELVVDVCAETKETFFANILLPSY